MKITDIILDGTKICAVKTAEGIVPAQQIVKYPFGDGNATTADVVLSTDYLGKLRSKLDGRKELHDAINEKEAVFASPIGFPEKIICIGLNYRNHALETKKELPDYPTVFSKFNNSISAHEQDIRIPESVKQVDYEGELGILIGKTARNVSVQDSMNYVFGYFVANDVSARDMQYRTTQWLLGKTLDGFFSTGPYITTADEINDPQNLQIVTRLNGEIRQNSNTSNMIFRCDYLVSYLSHFMTLRPGDVISTGTPEGVILGMPPEKRVWLRNGDIVEVEIEKLGTLRNRFVS
ncbi:4-hydroxyphenylacetate degradation bifunctional isomerase/decarboxylase [Thermoplasmatales archaeon]|nr:4-hydroxyphenylacetate degradation bifunctional isomerase/decarboxylase [Thermoplasmatales archaeon]